MTQDNLTHAEQRVLEYLAQGRTIGPTDAEHLAYVTGLDVASAKEALRRLDAKGRVRIGRDGRWLLV